MTASQQKSILLAGLTISAVAVICTSALAQQGTAPAEKDIRETVPLAEELSTNVLTKDKKTKSMQKGQEGKQSTPAAISVPLSIAGVRKNALIVAEKAGAGKSLAETLGRITGQTCRVFEAAPTGAEFTIHVGRTDYVNGLGLDFDKLHPYGYYIIMPDTAHLVLAGRSLKQGTPYAVADFLKRFCGWRVFMPGELGEILPHLDEIKLPAKLNCREEPSFVTYNVLGFNGANAAFTRAFRMTLMATHNLSAVFPPAKYGKDHPEYYPMRDGKRMVPSEKSEGGWQPCVSNPDLPAIAVEYAREYFQKRPEQLGVPLGVNDGGGHCQCEKCLAWKAAYRNQYVPFYNAAAKLFRKEFPGTDKFISFIGYGEPGVCPVNIRLEPGIHVELCNGLRNNLAELKKWKDVGADSLAVYDYYYGSAASGYVVPRHYPHVIGAAWKRACKEYGIRGGFFELVMRVWLYDGPRQYVLDELAWNIDAKVDDLLDDYFSRFYVEAGQAVRRFFDRHEEVYARRADPLFPMQDSTWAGHFMTENNIPTQFNDYTHEDLAYCWQCLDEAKAAVKDEKASRRLTLLRKIFDLTSRMIQPYLVYKELCAAKDIRSRDEVLGLMRRFEKGLGFLDALDAYTMTKEEEEAIFTKTSLDKFRGRIKSQSLRPYLEIQADRIFSEAETGVEAGKGWPAARAFCLEAAKQVTNSAAQAVVLTPVYCREAAEANKNVITGGDCEPAGAAGSAVPSEEKRVAWGRMTVPGWQTVTPGKAKAEFYVDAESPHGGKYCLAVGENERGGLFRQNVKVTPGCRYRLAFWVKQVPPDKGGYASVNSINVPYPEQAETAWRKVENTFTAPASAKTVILSLGGGGMRGQNLKPGEYVWFDDISMTKIYDPAFKPGAVQR
jgi:hypothetical protein